MLVVARQVVESTALWPIEGYRFVDRGASLGVGADLSLSQGLVVEAEAWLVNFCSTDRVEGLRAFVEKRQPASQPP